MFTLKHLSAPILALSIGMVAVLPLSSEAANPGAGCIQSTWLYLKGKPKARAERWKPVFKDSLAKQSPQAALYAILRMALEMEEELHLNPWEKKQLKLFVRDLELSSIDDRSMGFLRKTWSLLTTHLGRHRAFQDQIYRIDVQSAHPPRLLRLLNAWEDMLSVDFLRIIFPVLIFHKPKAVNPVFYYQSTPEILSTGRNLRLIVDHALQEMDLDRDFESQLFLKSYAPVWRSKQGGSYLSWEFGRHLIPLYMLGLSIWGLNGVVPRQIAQRILTLSFVPSAYSHYELSQFRSDVESQIGPLGPSAGKKLLLAHSPELFSSIDLRKNPMAGISEITDLAEDSNTTVLPIKNLDELNKLNLKNYDNVIVFAHGTFAGDFTLKWGQSKPKLKRGANLIFISCALGQVGEAECEKWVEFSEMVLDSGRAFSSTHNIHTLIKSEAAGPVVREKPDDGNDLFTYSLAVALEVSGIYPILEVGYNVYLAGNTQYYFSPVMLRVYDSQTNKVIDLPMKKERVTSQAR